MFTQQLPFSLMDPGILLYMNPPKLAHRGCYFLANFSRQYEYTHSLGWNGLDYRLQKDCLSSLIEKRVLPIVDVSLNCILNYLKGSVFVLFYHYQETKVFLLIIVQREP